MICLLLLSVIYPAVSHDKADLALVPQTLRFDWFYLHVYPLIQQWSPGWVWALLVGSSAVIVIAPWVPPQRPEQVALVTLDYCNGCERCVDDCPFAAVEMVPRTDGTSYTQQAQVDPDLCVSCGLCVGACPTATPFRSRSELVPGIDLPDRTMADLRAEIAASAVAGTGVRVLVFGCRSDRQLDDLESAGAPVIAELTVWDSCHRHLSILHLAGGMRTACYFWVVRTGTAATAWAPNGQSNVFTGSAIRCCADGSICRALLWAGCRHGRITLM